MFRNHYNLNFPNYESFKKVYLERKTLKNPFNIELIMEAIPVSEGEKKSYQFSEVVDNYPLNEMIKIASSPVYDELIKGRFFNVLFAAERKYYELELEANGRELGENFDLQSWKEWYIGEVNKIGQFSLLNDEK